MKRTAADFAREAPQDGPYELEVGTGRSKRYIQPKPATDQTFEQRKEHARLLDLWINAQNSVDREPPTRPDGEPEMEPLIFSLRCRFDAVTYDKSTQRWTAKDSADYDAFWKTWVDPLPWDQVLRCLEDIDRYYDPTPATDGEKDDAAEDPDGDAAGKSGTGDGS